MLHVCIFFDEYAGNGHGRRTFLLCRAANDFKKPIKTDEISTKGLFERAKFNENISMRNVWRPLEISILETPILVSKTKFYGGNKML